MMTPTIVIQEAARMRTRQQIQQADVYRASRTSETGRTRRRSLGAVVAAVFAKGRPAVRPIQRPSPSVIRAS